MKKIKVKIEVFKSMDYKDKTKNLEDVDKKRYE